MEIDTNRAVVIKYKLHEKISYSRHLFPSVLDVLMFNCSLFSKKNRTLETLKKVRNMSRNKHLVIKRESKRNVQSL